MVNGFAVNYGMRAGGIVGDVYEYLGRPNDFTTASGTQTIAVNDVVKLADDYTVANGNPGQLYQFIGTPGSINLSTENYTVTSKWKNLSILNGVG